MGKHSHKHGHESSDDEKKHKHKHKSHKHVHKSKDSSSSSSEDEKHKSSKHHHSKHAHHHKKHKHDHEETQGGSRSGLSMMLSLKRTPSPERAVPRSPSPVRRHAPPPPASRDRDRPREPAASGAPRRGGGSLEAGWTKRPWSEQCPLIFGAGLLGRGEVTAQSLHESCKPQLEDPNKRVVYEIACPPGASFRGTIQYARWRALPMPDSFDAAPPSAFARRNGRTGPGGTAFECRKDGYDYAAAGGPEAFEWHVNFADSELFCAYGSELFAQDEMQAAEHPSLGLLREHLAGRADREKRAELEPVAAEGRRPTPWLLRGVERRVRVDTGPSKERPAGLYGRAFASASAEAVRGACKPVVPPTTSNLICMAAPKGGPGKYTVNDIQDVLATAYTGFLAARAEAQLAAQGERSGGEHFRPAPEVVVHTGNWGAGAFGGNLVLSHLLQMAAARLAGLDRLVFHAFDAAGAEAHRHARELLDTRLKEFHVVRNFVTAVEGLGFEWGAASRGPK
eukprot:tig00000880_g5172.t1